jgi:membrane-associated protease RseP (regulator of RpoE activity)
MEEGRPRFGAWLNILLFAVTCASAFFVGLSWSVSYIFSDQLTAGSGFTPPARAFSDPRVIGLSLVYALVLIIILLGHEMGHYLTCRHYRIEATLPFFIPAPTLIGTLGAFIRIKSPITLKKHLFDIGIAGPLAGFVLSLPAIVYGLSLSKVLPAVPRDQALVLGEPLLLKFISGILFKNAPAGSDLFLHPVAFAGWVGMLVTAFNLFPIGQLDGGHVSYAFLGQKSKSLTKVFLAVFLVMGVLFWVGWIVWALVILLLGMKHPRVFDEQERLSAARRALGFAAVIIFVLSFNPAPIKGFSLLELVKQWGL